MKRIRIDDTTKEEILNKFKEYLSTSKFSNTTLHFSTNLNNIVDNKEISKPTVYIDAEAYLKILLYVRDTTTEIAWHGTVERDIERNLYYIKDVFLYPQKLSAATVQTDQEDYQNWLTELDDKTYNNLRFQGHSHVNFSPSPSGTDLDYYDSMLQVLPNSDYYTFMIINKTGNMTFLIYDLAANMIYETADIDFKILASNTDDLTKTIEKDKDKFCKSPATIQKAWESPRSRFDIYDDDYYAGFYGNTKKKEDVNDIIDDINIKFKNPTLKSDRKKVKTKVKGVKV